MPHLEGLLEQVYVLIATTSFTLLDLSTMTVGSFAVSYVAAAHDMSHAKSYVVLCRLTFSFGLCGIDGEFSNSMLYSLAYLCIQRCPIKGQSNDSACLLALLVYSPELLQRSLAVAKSLHLFIQVAECGDTL